MKKVIVSLLCAMMIMSLVACGAENNEANESNNSTVTEDKTDSTNSNSDTQSATDENITAENDEQDSFINVSIENGFVNIIINHEDMAILDKENTEVWVRFYDSEDRLSGVEITATKQNFVVVPIPYDGGETLADGYNENSYLAGTCLSFDFSNDEVAELIGASDNYEIIIRDWNDATTPEMIMDGKSDSIGGIHIYKVTYLNPDTEIVEDNTLEEVEEIEEQTTDENDDSNSLYLEVTYSDGISTIVFHGTNPTHPTSMSINGERIVFDSVDIVENSENCIQLGLNWTIDDCPQWGEMYYLFEDRHIILKGFAVANEYVPAR